MKGEVIGVKPVSFTDKEGKDVIGNKLFVIAEDVDCFGKSCSEVWIGAGTPLEKKIASYLSDLDRLIGSEVEFSFKPKSTRVAQFDIISEA